MAAITKTRCATRSSVTGGGVWWRSESNICGGFGRPKSFRGRRKLVRSQRLPAVAACAKLPPTQNPRLLSGGFGTSWDADQLVESRPLRAACGYT
jgi:hypothetical protein